MRSISFASLCSVFGLIGVVCLVDARVDHLSIVTDVVYDSKTKVYQHQEQRQFANHSLEQKMLTIQFITRHDDQLATKAVQ